jgi:Ethanolamine utilization protein EutJ (predicted chaperonin)
VTDLRARRSGGTGGDDTSANGVVVHVRDAATGRVLVMAGEQSIELEDHELVKAFPAALRDGEG